jgi:hypothetical protein
VELETLVGRSLAMCVHPYAVWRLRSSRGRALVVIAYIAAGYVLVFGTLQLMSF